MRRATVLHYHRSGKTTSGNHYSDYLQDFTPELVVTHPDYNKPSRYQNDIAVVRLSGAVVEHGE